MKLWLAAVLPVTIILTLYYYLFRKKGSKHMNNEREFLNLLKVLLRVSEAAKGTTVGKDERVLDAEGLLVKFVYHSMSAFYLTRSTTIPELRSSFVDIGSVDVLCRAALESFLTFHYVFNEAQTDDEKDFRYWSWVLGGLVQRQKYVVRQPESIEKLAREKEVISKISNNLRANSYYLALNSKKQDEMTNKGKWRLKSWTDIGLSAGLSRTHAKQFYNHLCEHAHSGSISVSQIYQANSIELQRSLAFTTLEVIMITMAFMIKSYVTIFPQGKDFVNSNSEVSGLVDKWIAIGSYDPDESSQ